MTIHTKIGELQQTTSGIVKGATNPFYESKYFDINAMLKQLAPELVKHGLVLTQPMRNGEVCSILTDPETGEHVESCIPLPNDNNPQKMGSAVTYYRRYTLQSLLALQALDDDGNLAAKPAETIELSEEGKQFYLDAKALKKELKEEHAQDLTQRLRVAGLLTDENRPQSHLSATNIKTGREVLARFYDTEKYGS